MQTPVIALNTEGGGGAALGRTLPSNGFLKSTLYDYLISARLF